jgi:hypothetical protein
MFDGQEATPWKTQALRADGFDVANAHPKRGIGISHMIVGYL